MPSPILVEPLQWNDTHVQILEMILGYISGHRNTEEEKMVKSFHKIIVLCMAILCCHGCGEDTFYTDIKYPFIRFVNQSNDTVWIEMLNSREITFYFEGTIEDSIFYGIDRAIPPHTVKQIEAHFYPHWVEYHYGDSYIKDTASFIARVCVMDSCAPVDIEMARQKYYRELYKTDSIQVLETLRKFEQDHLLLKHWYSKEELDSMNWTIVYPQNR